MNWVLKSTQPANHPNQLPDTGSVTTLGWGLVTKFAWFLPWNPDILPDCLIYLGFYHSYQTIIWTDIYHNYHFTIKKSFVDIFYHTILPDKNPHLKRWMFYPTKPYKTPGFSGTGGFSCQTFSFSSRMGGASHPRHPTPGTMKMWLKCGLIVD